MTVLKTIQFLLAIAFSIPQMLVAQEGKWISTPLEKNDTINVWLAFKKEIELGKTPKTAKAKIAADSKYWLYINGELVVFEGSLKRGPNPNDSYYDEVDLTGHLKKGKNTIALQLWYFGKDGFSHNSSGKPGVYFDLHTDATHIISDNSWQVKRMKEYKTAAAPIPNFRLPESSIWYDARIGSQDWIKAGSGDAGFSSALEIGEGHVKPWGKLHRRPIPLWKDFGLKEISSTSIKRNGDTLICKLPYNMQFTPYIEIRSPAGKQVKMLTDNYIKYNGAAENIRAEYTSKNGFQAYESLGWINGHYLYVIAPKEVEILKVKYRETGYDTEFSGSFTCSDPFFNRLWAKAQRTLYITMRDTYMDCPDRERAQWTGDAVLEAEEAFYALDVKSHALTKKWLYELIQWQKPNGVLYAPIPAGNWDKELPDQVLASIGYYGIWKYYLHTGDKQILKDLYPNIQTYLNLWEKDSDGLVKLRAGGWQWGDWGDNKDMLLLYNLWYYLAIHGSQLMATELGLKQESLHLKEEMEKFANTFNARFWKDGTYRDPAYKGKTDDRVQALAILSGIAQKDKYTAIEQVFATQEHASPYIEKYVFEAMFKMNIPEKALARHKKRFSTMVNNSYFSTLFEGWGIGNQGFGGGTVNHAWSGGGLTILSARLCGIEPLTAGYQTFAVNPQMGNIKQAEAKISTVKGDISVALNQDDTSFTMKLKVPSGSSAKVFLPANKHQNLLVNKRIVLPSPKNIEERKQPYQYQKQDHTLILSEGNWEVQTKL